MRVLFDANVWIRFLLTRNERSTIRQVIQRCLAGVAELIIPEELLTELQTSAGYPHLAKRIQRAEFDFLMTRLRQAALIPPSLAQEIQQYSRDRKDDYLVAYGLVYEADYLVTGNQDLLALGLIEGLRIVTPAAFRSMLEEQRRK
jgi:putative PIN family toxin of toxin-antitoxin system